MLKDLRFRGLIAVGSVLALAGLAGCPSYTFLEILPERVTENQINVEPGKPIPADILFVVDNSCSMEDEQELLAQNFNDFIGTLTNANTDYRIGVVTTSLKVGQGQPLEERGGVTVSNFSNAEPYILVGLPNASACQPVGIPLSCFRGPDAAKRIVSSADSPDAQISAFRENVRVGSCGIGQEEGLGAMLQALSQTAGASCNSGFLRPEANLVIVILSDEDDQSDLRDIDLIIQQLAALKPLSKVRFAAIVGAVQGASGATAAKCGAGGNTQCGGLCNRYGPVRGSETPCRQGPSPCDNGEVCDLRTRCVEPGFQYWQYCDWCTYYNAPDCCSALSGSQYVTFAKELENRIAQESGNITATGCQLDNPDGTRVGCLVDSICQASFSETLRRIATDLVITNEVALNPPASFPPGVVVKVNGEEWVNGVDYEVTPDGATLQYKARAPGQGDVVEVFYTLPN